MTAALYTRLAATALRLLTKYGQPVTLRNYTAGVYSPALGTATPQTADSTRQCAVFDYPNGQFLDPSSLIQSGDKKGLMDANGAAPSLEDHIITADGIEYVIKQIKTLAPAGAAVIHELQLRT